MNIIGQNKLLSIIDSYYAKQNLPKTLLFLGPAGCGKHTLAKYITEKFNLDLVELDDSITAENIEDYGGWIPTREYEQKGVIASMEEYDDAMFWENLIHKLALKDVAQFADVNNPDILFSAIDQRMEQYSKFFEDNDFSKVKVEGMEEFEIPDTFRTMNVGEIDMDAFADYDEEEDE